MVFSYFTISSLINALTSFGLCFLVLLRNPRAQLNRSFGLFAFSVGFWAINHFFAFGTQNEAAALFLHRALMAGAIFIPTTFFHFVCHFLDIYDEKKPLIISSYIASFVFLLSDFTPLFIPSVSKKLFFEYFENFGPMYHPFLVMFAGLTLYSHYLMFKGFRSTTGAKNNQIKYVFVGTLIGFLGGSTNFLLVYNIPVPPIGNCLVTVYIVMVAIAIQRYNLMSLEIASIELLARASSFLLLSTTAYFSVRTFLLLSNITEITIVVISSLIAMALFYSLDRKFSSIISHRLRPRPDLKETLKRYTESKVIASHNVKELANLIVKTISDNLKTQKCSLMLLDKQNNLYGVVASVGLDEEIKSIAFRESNHLIKALKNSNHIGIIIKDELHKAFSREGEAHLIKRDLDILDAQTCIPLLLKGQLIGLLNLGPRASGGLYTPEELDFIFAFTTQSAMMLRFLEEIGEFEEKLVYTERLAGIDEMLGSTNHELNNLISGIRSAAQILDHQQGLSPEDRDQMMQQVLTYTTRASAVTGWVNDYRRKLDYTEPIEVDTKKAIDEAIPAIKEQLVLSLEKVQIIKDIPQDLPKLQGKATLPDLFFHLLTNSCYSMEKKGGQLKISVQKLNQDDIEIKITDTGGDIAERMKLGPDFGGRWFAERSQLGGLNLFLARHITTDHQGTFEDPKSNKGKGAIFVARIPIKQPKTKDSHD